MCFMFICHINYFQTSHQSLTQLGSHIRGQDSIPDQCFFIRRCRCPGRLRRGSAAARLLGLRVRIPPGVWTSVSCECCVLSGRGFLRGADLTSRGVPPSVVYLMCVISKPPQWRPRPGTLSKGHRKKYFVFSSHYHSPMLSTNFHLNTILIRRTNGRSPSAFIKDIFSVIGKTFADKHFPCSQNLEI